MGKEPFSSVIIGAAGEFYVASYLSALGLVVALPRGGVPSSDLLVTNTDGNKTISLQIKTATQALNRSKKYDDYLTWRLSTKSRGQNGCDSHWYVFVDLRGWPKSKDGYSPDIYFVPAQDINSIFKTNWNKEDATSIWFPLFKEINAKNEEYVPSKNNAAYFKGLLGFEKMEHCLTADK